MPVGLGSPSAPNGVDVLPPNVPDFTSLAPPPWEPDRHVALPAGEPEPAATASPFADARSRMAALMGGLVSKLSESNAGMAAAVALICVAGVGAFQQAHAADLQVQNGPSAPSYESCDLATVSTAAALLGMQRAGSQFAIVALNAGTQQQVGDVAVEAGNLASGLLRDVDLGAHPYAYAVQQGDAERPEQGGVLSDAGLRDVGSLSVLAFPAGFQQWTSSAKGVVAERLEKTLPVCRGASPTLAKVQQFTQSR